jgi:hypothetical protein
MELTGKAGRFSLNPLVLIVMWSAAHFGTLSVHKSHAGDINENSSDISFDRCNRLDTYRVFIWFYATEKPTLSL